MKKIVLFLLLSACTRVALAQIYVEGVLLTPENTGQYLELDPVYKVYDGACGFYVDYGQAEPLNDLLTDKDKKRFDFRSLVDGLNYFYANGWELLAVTDHETRGRRFILKRRY
ncbi:MAG: hypothetical protein KGS48_06090 [Bacteroidetes bacterium]|nr:hypothetical protein [Bacteroidota bacterium]